MHELCSIEDAVAAIRVSAGTEDESIVVLVCDHENRIVFAVDFAGAPASGVCDAVECVLDAVLQGTVLVVGIVRPHDPGGFTDAEAEAINDLVESCHIDDVCLRDLIVVSRDGWRSVPDVDREV
jgi:hypothetical protein